MSLKEISSLNSFIKRMKKSIRFWFWTTIFFWSTFIGLCIWANTSQSLATGVFLFCAIIYLILFFKGNSKNAILIAEIKDFSDVLKVPALAGTYKNIRFFAKFIWFLDLLLITSVLTFPLKIYFWIAYRVFRSSVKKLKKLISKGEKVFTFDEMENDPFYSFLIREGLYEKSKITTKSSLEVFMEETADQEEQEEQDSDIEQEEEFEEEE